LCFPQVSRANLTRLQAKVEAMVMSVIYGVRLRVISLLNIQKDKPADWQAFLARIDEVYEFDSNGTKKEIKLKEEKYSQTVMVLMPIDPDELPF